MVRMNLIEARKKHKIQYDKRAKELKYEAGDRVLLDWKGVVPSNKNKKWLPKFEGPYRVIQVFENGTADIMGEGVSKRVNRKRLVPFHETMLWHDEPCPEIKSIPTGTTQFQREESDNEETEGQGSEKDENIIDNEGQTAEEGMHTSEIGGNNRVGKGQGDEVSEDLAVLDNPATTGSSQNSSTETEELVERINNRYGLRDRNLLKSPHWLKKPCQINESSWYVQNSNLKLE